MHYSEFRNNYIAEFRKKQPSAEPRENVIQSAYDDKYCTLTVDQLRQKSDSEIILIVSIILIVVEVLMYG